MKALVGAFNQEKALVGAFSVIVQPVVEPMDRFTAVQIIGIGGMAEVWKARGTVENLPDADLVVLGLEVLVCARGVIVEWLHAS